MRTRLLTLAAATALLGGCGSWPRRSPEALMREGTDALYARRSPREAEAKFRKILELNPAHYGATYQLAAALEAAGDPEAAALWERVLVMAEHYDDRAGAEAARSRLPGFPVVVMKTSMGEVRARLNARRAPITTANFLSYVREGFYDGTIFHRIWPGGFVQGGALTPDRKPKPGARGPIKLESQNGLGNRRGTLNMARTPDPDSATVHFVISVADTSWMNYSSPGNPGYAVFGEVISGMEVVDAINRVPLGQDEAPLVPVVIESIRLAER